MADRVRRLADSEGLRREPIVDEPEPEQKPKRAEKKVKAKAEPVEDSPTPRPPPPPTPPSTSPAPPADDQPEAGNRRAGAASRGALHRWHPRARAAPPAARPAAPCRAFTGGIPRCPSGLRSARPRPTVAAPAAHTCPCTGSATPAATRWPSPTAPSPLPAARRAADPAASGPVVAAPVGPAWSRLSPGVPAPTRWVAAVARAFTPRLRCGRRRWRVFPAPRRWSRRASRWWSRRWSRRRPRWLVRGWPGGRSGPPRWTGVAPARRVSGPSAEASSSRLRGPRAGVGHKLRRRRADPRGRDRGPARHTIQECTPLLNRTAADLVRLLVRRGRDGHRHAVLADEMIELIAESLGAEGAPRRAGSGGPELELQAMFGEDDDDEALLAPSDRRSSP